jgi:hypothetical protein
MPSVRYQGSSGPGSEYGSYPAKADLVSITDLLASLGCELLLVDEGKVGAVQVFDEVVSALHDDPGMLPGYAPFLTAMRRQVDLRIDAADWILTSHEDLIAFRQRDLGPRVRNHQARASRGWGGWGLHNRCWGA